VTKNSLTLALEGDVSLSDFSKALHDFTSLVDELTNEVARGANIDWLIEELYSGSAVTTIHGIYEDIIVVENVVTAFENIGEALATGQDIPYSQEVKNKAGAITRILDGRITAIRFETAEKDSFISGKSTEGIKSEPIKYSYGTVKGIVQTLSMRRRLNFTLWDAIFDKAVNCYLQEGQEENMREVWGKRAVVSGKIGRQPDTGFPVVVREIKNIEILKDMEPGSYKRARGVIPWKKGYEKPEDIIRRLRDG